MTELHFKGKEFVYNHHLAVPFRPLVPEAAKSIGAAALSENLLIHGDNLHALKALLPYYASAVDCIFIDPPYNTGNESWSYNDNVDSPMMREWLAAAPINKDDMLRHDKWLCMMYPRLKLLYELLSDTGSLWVTLDDNEVHHARVVLDEIFGEESFVGQLVWQKRTSRENRAALASAHDHILLYVKSTPDLWKAYRNLLDPSEEGYSNPDSDPRGVWKSIPFTAQGFRTNQVYPITTPSGNVVSPPVGRCWGATEPVYKQFLAENRVYFPNDGDSRPRIKQFPTEAKGLVPSSLWLAADVGDTEEAKKEILAIFGDARFETPKPRRLVERIIEIATKSDSVVLDSFAGSGTTGHAVLSVNHRRNSSRRFVLVEAEELADSVTATRIRRAIGGYSFIERHSEVLVRKNLTLTSLRKSAALLARARAVQQHEADRFEKVSISVKKGALVVTGSSPTEKTIGPLGGSFTYCELGEPIDLDALLTGEQLPDYETIGAWLYHTATSETLDTEATDEESWFLGESSGYYVWLIYKPDLDFLKSSAAALTLDLAKKIGEKGGDKPHLVFAPTKYVPNKVLLPMRVNFSPLPFALFRVERA